MPRTLCCPAQRSRDPSSESLGDSLPKFLHTSPHSLQTRPPHVRLGQIQSRTKGSICQIPLLPPVLLLPRHQTQLPLLPSIRGLWWG